jgi:hypothetical protein
MSQVPPELARVERACRELTDAGQEITFPAVAAHASIGRATLYRRPELRAVVEEHRAHARDAHTLSGLATQVAQLREALQAVAANVTRHEEELRRLRRRDR